MECITGRNMRPYMFCCSLTSSWETGSLLYHLFVKVQCTKLRATSSLYPVFSGPEFRCGLPAHVLGKMCGFSKDMKECKQHILHWKRKNKGQWGNSKKASSSDFLWALPAGAHARWPLFLHPFSYKISCCWINCLQPTCSERCVIPSTQSSLIACLDFSVLWICVHKEVVCSPTCWGSF